MHCVRFYASNPITINLSSTGFLFTNNIITTLRGIVYKHSLYDVSVWKSNATTSIDLLISLWDTVNVSFANKGYLKRSDDIDS